MGASWVQPISKTYAPRVLCAVAYDPIDVQTSNTGYATTAGSWSVLTTRRRGTKWERVRSLSSDGCPSETAWTAIEKSGTLTSRSYVISTTVVDCLTLLNFWHKVDNGLCSLRLAESSCPSKSGRPRKRRRHPLVLSGSPDVVGWSIGPCEYRAVSLGNHMPIPLVESAKLAGIDPPADNRVRRRPTGHPFPDSPWTVRALTAVYQRLIGFWVENDAGRWSDTIGAAALQWWRTTVEKGETLQHDHPEATALEGAAVYGGRAQLFWFGSAGTGEPDPIGAERPEPAAPIHRAERCWKLDVRSMYLSLLRDKPFPCRLLHRLRNPTVDTLRNAVRHVLVVSTVRVRLESPRLPYLDHRGRIVYPVGEWWTTLTTPEVAEALERGEVTAVGETWAYQPGRQFREFASQMIGLRQLAIAAGDSAGGMFTKLIGNALGGKLGARKGGWVTEPTKPCRHRWGEWAEVDADSGEVTRCRGIAGMRQRYVDRGERAGGLTACYAHLCGEGRVMLGGLIERVGPSHCLWVDTDGLIVTETGLERLRATGADLSGTPGTLRIEGEVKWFAARTPKHYYRDGEWTLAGVRGDFGAVSRHRVKCYHSANPVRSGVDPGAGSLPTVGRVVRLDAIPLSGTPGLDAWLIPPVVSDGVCRQPGPPSDGWDPDGP